MPENVSALQLVLSGDPALFAIVRLSLVVSLSAAVFGALVGIPAGAALALTRFPRPRGGDRRSQCADGTAAGRGRARGLSPALALRTARVVGPAVHAAGDGDRADRS